jgi:hypothetical protein
MKKRHGATSDPLSLGTKVHGSAEPLKSFRKAFVIRLMDGLGNQLFQYALGRQLCSDHDAELVFDASWYRNAAQASQPRALGLSEYTIRGRLVADDAACGFWIRPTLAGKVWWRVEQELMPLHRRRFISQDPNEFSRTGKMFDPRILRAQPGTYLSGWWISPFYFGGVEDQLRSELVLNRSVPGSALPILSRIRTSNSVAVHVRRGDYLKHPDIGVLDASYYLQAIRHVRSVCSNPHFFVFSDDPCAASQLLGPILPEFELVELPKGISPAVDLHLMSACKHFINANSTFSWWGAWLSRNPAKVVVVPEYWYCGARRAMKDVYPLGWIRMGG